MLTPWQVVVLAQSAYAMRFFLNAYKPPIYPTQDILPLLNTSFFRARAEPQNQQLKCDLDSICQFIIDTNTDYKDLKGRRLHD